MKKVMGILLIGISILLLAGHLFAEEVSVIWEKQFDELLEDVILEEEEMTVQKAQTMGIKGVKGNPDDKLKVKVPKVLITKNAIKFLTDNQVKKEIAIGNKIKTYLLKSPSQKRIAYYKANLKIPANEKEYGIIESTSFNILDVDGNETLTKIFNGGYDFIISDNGNFVAFDSGSEGIGGTIYFYDSNGNLIRQVKPFEKGYFSFKGTYSKTGEYLAVSFNKFGELGGALILFDSQGNEIWRKKISNWDNATSQIIISPDDRYIYTVGTIFIEGTTNKREDYIYCFNLKGDIVIERRKKYQKEMELPNGLNIGKFSSDGNYLVLSADIDIRFGAEQKVELIDIVNNKSLWTYKDIDSNISIDSFDISSNGNYIVVSMWENPEIGNKKIMIFDKQGKIILKRDYISKYKLKDYIYEDDLIEKTTVKIDEVRKKLYLVYGKKVEILDIVQ